MTEAILFDLDGTLLDTAPELAHAMNLTLADYKKDSINFPAFRQIISGGSNHMVTHAFDIKTNHADFNTIKQRFLNYYQQLQGSKTEKFAGVDTLLDYLDQQTIPWGIVTNKHKQFSEPLLEKLNLNTRAKCIVSGDTTPHRKPHPEPLLHASRLMQYDPSAITYIGDSRVDATASRAAQMKNIIVTYGYYSADDNPQNWGADFVVDKALDIIDYLDQSKQ